MSDELCLHQLEIKGRCDSMVKIRGYSINLAIVEKTLREQFSLKGYVVLL